MCRLNKIYYAILGLKKYFHHFFKILINLMYFFRKKLLACKFNRAIPAVRRRNAHRDKGCLPIC